MKSRRRIGCRTTLSLLFALGLLVFVFLFTSFRQERADRRGDPSRGHVQLLGRGGTIPAHEKIRGNLLVVGDNVVLKGQVGGNLVVLGGDVDMAENARVDGNVSVVGGDVAVTQAARVGGNIAVGGGDVALTGASRVGGNVRVVGGTIRREETARVEGTQRWNRWNVDANEAALDAEIQEVVLARGDALRAAALIQAQDAALRQAEAQRRMAAEAQDAALRQAEAQRRMAAEAQDAALRQAEAQRMAAEAQFASHRPPWFLLFIRKLALAFLWTALITGLVLLFYWLLPKQTEQIAGVAEREPALSFATGAIVVVGSALVAVILTITICFALLALPLLALLALLALGGWTATCYWLGRRVDAFLASQSKLTWNPLISIGLCSLFVTGAAAFAWAIFPCLGFFAILMIGSTGTGAVIVHLARQSGLRLHAAPPDGSDGPGPAVGAAPPPAQK